MLLKIVQLGVVAGVLFGAWRVWQNAPSMRIAVVLGLALAAWAVYAILGGGNAADEPPNAIEPDR
jgi:hypothetical protein